MSKTPTPTRTPTPAFRWIRNHVPRCPFGCRGRVLLPHAQRVHPFPPTRVFFPTGSLTHGDSAGFDGVGVFPCYYHHSHQPGLHRWSLRCTCLPDRDLCGFGGCSSVQNSGIRGHGWFFGLNCRLWLFWMLGALVWIRLPIF